MPTLETVRLGGLHRQQPFNPLTFIAIHVDPCLSNDFFTRKPSKDQIKSTNQLKHVFIVNYLILLKKTSACAGKKLTFLGEVSNILTSREGLGNFTRAFATMRCHHCHRNFGSNVSASKEGAFFHATRKVEVACVFSVDNR